MVRQTANSIDDMICPFGRRGVISTIIGHILFIVLLINAMNCRQHETDTGFTCPLFPKVY